MLDTEKEKLIKQLQEEANKIHSSTKVDIGFLSPIHNYFRSRSAIYYKWALNSKASAIHLSGFLGFIVSLIIIMLLNVFG